MICSWLVEISKVRRRRSRPVAECVMFPFCTNRDNLIETGRLNLGRGGVILTLGELMMIATTSL